MGIKALKDDLFHQFSGLCGTVPNTEQVIDWYPAANS